MEKAVAPDSSTLAWKIPWAEEPGRLQSMGSWRVGHEGATWLSFFTFMHWRRTWQPTPVFLPGESQGRRSLMGCRVWGRQSRTRLKRLSSSSMPSLEKCAFRSLSDFFYWIVCFLILCCTSCLYVLEINSLWVSSFARIFSILRVFFFLSLVISFSVQLLLMFIRSHLFIFHDSKRWITNAAFYVKVCSVFFFSVS